ncbi:SDR family NAD(P)-dependent oxidoreductase [Tahibacter soli]|uniref:NADP-dependent 3-hydroxy acid dehydrogenase YdfG n=1 Tax=Tahibacter soli TaxID=2983605 RepID=A0A9X3YPR9_9GAMM|nr:SDR family oxidoreductase [Tahibacter soli]MDC8014633.1 SDR family oxidoreductase [Tahibacter soli]
MTNSITPGTALITGASSGIGAIYADRLARRGHDLVLVARSRDKLDALAQRLRAATGRAVDVLPADLADRADLARVEARLASDAAITVLVNNAGIGAYGALVDTPVERVDPMIDLNVTALTRLTYAAVPGMVARGRGTIVNIASIVAIAPELLNGVYGASKAYVLSLSQSLAHELDRKGVRVQAVLPGATATEFWDVAGVDIGNLPKEMVMSADAMVDAALAGLDLGEFATIPALPDAADWQRYEDARQRMRPNLSHTQPAARYRA